MESISVHTEFLIIGAGIAGLSLAIGLTQRNKDFIILEQSPLIEGIGAGLGITSNAISALGQIQMADKIRAIANPLASLRVVNQAGKLLMNGNPKLIAGYDLTNYALHRSHLHQAFLEEIDSQKIFTKKTVTTIQQEDATYKVTCKDGTTVTCNYLVGADGLHSVVRRYLFPESSIRYAGYTCWRAVINLKDDFPYTSEETWGVKGRFGITPLLNQQVYWYACINSKTARSPQYTAYTIGDLKANFKDYHPAVIKALDLTENSRLIHNDIADLTPLKQYYKGNAVLIGDAAHATTPNLGQGACMGLEDMAVLLQEIDSHKDVVRAMAQYSERRVKRCRFIVNTSRRMGRLAQMDIPALIPVRNFFVSHLPKALQRRQISKLLDTKDIL